MTETWRITDHRDRRHREFAIMSDTGGLDGEGGKVASVWAGFGHHYSFEEAQRHARLIAAAPNLRAAASDAMRAPIFGTEPMIAIPQVAYDALRVALAKASGE
jgi:hypothetical protein